MTLTGFVAKPNVNENFILTCCISQCCVSKTKQKQTCYHVAYTCCRHLETALASWNPLSATSPYMTSWLSQGLALLAVPPYLRG